MLNAPAPLWLVSIANWLSKRWLFPIGMARVWTFAGGEVALRQIFREPIAPVTWAHFAGRPYRPDCDALMILQPAHGISLADIDSIGTNLND